MITVRKAEEKDAGLILEFIKGLAEYEHLSDLVTADVDTLKDWIFNKKVAEVLFAVEERTEVGFALFFHNFSTFLGKAGIYLEDLYVKPAYRGRGHGKALLKEIARIAIERKCGRFEWMCLDWNEPSIRFYRSLGAVPVEGWTMYRVTGEALKTLANKAE